MRLTYAITVCNEHDELKRLLTQLNSWENLNAHEILIQYDTDNVTREVLDVIEWFRRDGKCGSFKDIGYPLNRDFASFKNNIRSHASGDFIFQIDADEGLADNLLNHLPELIEEYNDIDVFRISRINIVNGATEEHERMYGWHISSLPGYPGKRIINFPDQQWRIYRRNGRIQWKNKVHEILDGYESVTDLIHPDWSLIHIKDIQKQIQQNNFYQTIQP